MAAAGFGGDNESGGLISDINVTPLVDVVLVLLIIMMVAAPMLTETLGIKANLPAASTGESTPKSVFEVGIVKKNDASSGFVLSVNGKTVNEKELQALVQAKASQDPQVKAAISGDRGVTYGDAMHIADLIRKNGIVSVTFRVERAND